MSGTAVVTVPSEQVADARKALFGLKDAGLDALARGVDAYLVGGESVECLREQNRELHRIDDLLDQIDSSPCDDAPVALTGPLGLLQEFLYESLTSAVAAVLVACQDYHAGRGELDVLPQGKRAADVFVELFVEFEQQNRVAS